MTPSDDPDAWPRPSLPVRVLSWFLNPGGAPSLRRLRSAVAGKTALVTGASFGVGVVTARRLASAGARVLLVARSREKLDLLAAEIRSRGGTADVYPAELTDTDAVADLTKRVLDAHGPPDIVVSNASMISRSSLTS